MGLLHGHTDPKTVPKVPTGGGGSGEGHVSLCAHRSNSRSRTTLPKPASTPHFATANFALAEGAVRPCVPPSPVLPDLQPLPIRLYAFVAHTLDTLLGVVIAIGEQLVASRDVMPRRSIEILAKSKSEETEHVFRCCASMPLQADFCRQRHRYRNTDSKIGPGG